MAESAADGIDFLGDPRLKNGLAYFPGVSKDGKTALVGNVVQVALKAPTSGRQYLGYGYLKGLWLFRDDQAYMRIQHLAPVSEGAANDEIAYRAPEGGTGEAAELLVTTQPRRGWPYVRRLRRMAAQRLRELRCYYIYDY